MYQVEDLICLSWINAWIQVSHDLHDSFNKFAFFYISSNYSSGLLLSRYFIVSYVSCIVLHLANAALDTMPYSRALSLVNLNIS